MMQRTGLDPPEVSPEAVRMPSLGEVEEARTRQVHKPANKFLPNFDPEDPDCLTLVLLGEHIDPVELAELTDVGYTNLLLLTTAAGALINLVLSIGKIAGGLMYNSKALLADGIHSLSDLVSDIVAGGSGAMAGRKADDSMPWGYGKCEAMGTLWCSLMLLAAAGSMVYHLYDHFKELLNNNVEFVEWAAIWWAVASTVLKEVSFQFTYRVGIKINSQVLIANAWHHRSDALSSVAALAGVLLALLGWLWADAAAGLVVTLLLLKVGFDMLKEGAETLVDKSANEDVEEAVGACLNSLQTDGRLTGRLAMLRSRKMGRKNLLDLALNFSPNITMATVSLQVDTLRKQLKKTVPYCGEIVVQCNTELGDRTTK